VKIGFIDFQGLVEGRKTVFSFSGLSTRPSFPRPVLSCVRPQSFWRTVEVYLVGRLCPQAGVRASGVVELDVARDLASGFAHRLVGVQVDVLVFERTPEALDEDVVAPAALAVHADLDAFFFEPPGEGFAGELTT